ncbi:hypothetical protein [Rosistilla oblonga]|uniref:hypothetical protein n=1 Tax=Rosistilla oblonga TaxID=2527990 RepID=UPI003A9713E8
MGRVGETIHTINTTVRTFLMVCVAGILGSAGYVTYDMFDAERRKLAETESALATAQVELENAGVEIAEQAKTITRMETALQLLKVDQRLARLEVLSQQPQLASEMVSTTVRFTELSPEGNPIGKPKVFTIDGDVVYIDNWVVKFEDKFVESADIARGTSLTLFRRVFGEHQTPSDGFVIDEVGSMPQAYLRGGEPNEFEQEIWSKFWQFANDRKLAAEKGIRAAHGEAVSVKTEAGKSYLIELRASGGLSIYPEDRPVDALGEKS